MRDMRGTPMRPGRKSFENAARGLDARPYAQAWANEQPSSSLSCYVQKEGEEEEDRGTDTAS